jgi:prolyl-tRNA editing enzyme YbaK/EbsC (Cys-tRNA(Pro) deacylase)
VDLSASCEKKLKTHIETHGIEGEHLVFGQSCHSVEEAAAAANACPDDFVKNICLVDADGNLVVAIVKGEDRVSTTRVGKAIGKDKPRTATPEEILERTGYPCGGTPSFGYEAVFLVDERVMEKEWVLSGGGSENSLVRIAPSELLRANGGRVERIRR